MDKIAPIHPGEVLMEEFIEPLGLTQHRVAVAVGVPPRRINEIVHGKRRVTADTALRLARYFGTSEPIRPGGRARCPRGRARRYPADAVCVTLLGDVTRWSSGSTSEIGPFPLVIALGRRVHHRRGREQRPTTDADGRCPTSPPRARLTPWSP
jgi:addiction module HigA family antidote